jgi:hypothetical protein
MSWHTRRLYALENEYMVHLPQLSYRQARRKLHQAWQTYAPPRWRSSPPALEFGRGVFIAGAEYSCTYGRSRIVLSQKQREVATLLHETAHAVRNGDVSHGPRFVALLFRMLVDEGITTVEELAVCATRHGVDHRWLRHYEKVQASPEP